jgi:murein DD-endopeptidase MepM/ murein hydrolase activator NlpD
MKRIEFIFTVLICFLTIFISLTTSPSQPTSLQATPVSQKERTKVEQAIYQAISQQSPERLVTLVYQTQVMDLTFSPDSQWARAWLVPVDPQTGEAAPIEPGLTIIRKENTDWQVFLQGDEGWLEAIQASPDTLFAEEEKTMWIEMFQQVKMSMPTSALTGYRLPWKAGDTKYLSESVMHDKYYPSRSMHYAFDFYQPGTEASLPWDIYAAKSGTVYLAKDDVPTCTKRHCDNQGSGNYIILMDTTTTPTSYQLYLHLAQNSIPSALKVVGTQVIRGQFIAVADNTGASYGNHLHFQVHTSTNWFGQSVDIIFEDVGINGGRPRVKNQLVNDEPYCLHKDGYNDICDNFQTSYVSNNVPCQIPDSTPPYGDLITPDSHGIPVTSTLSLFGWGGDDKCGLATGQFIINYANAWQNIGPAFTTSPFSYELDLCDIPDGTIEAGLRLTDYAGNSSLVGAYSLSKNYTCPAPPKSTCIPGDNEVMLFEGSDYTGTCIPFIPGDYSDLGPLEGESSAIIVGANVQATLTISDNFTGRNETFYTNDNNLSDNRIGTNTAGAIRVNWNFQQSYPATLLSPSNGSVIQADDIVTLFWENSIATAESQVQLTSNVTSTYTSTWQRETYLHIENLTPGEYTWKVRGKNIIGIGTWSTPFTFTVSDTPTNPPAVLVPYTDTMETSSANWTATGFWVLVNDSSLSHRGTHSWWYKDSDGDYANDLPNHGDLTSPAFTVSTSGHYYLRFYYRYTTETQGSYWDQRWVQISIDNGPFRNSIQSMSRQQLTDDPFANELDDPYLSSQVYDLGILVPGQSFRVRFHFDTLDAYYNAFQGWAIDDVSVSTTPPDAPSDSNEPNNIPGQATLITSSSAIDGIISPQGDFDYFKFTASVGNRIVADIDAQNLGSQLDPYLYLLDSDGLTVLAENDDEIYGEYRDPMITFYTPHAGTYYLKLRAWDNPRIGGSQYFYTLHFYIDNSDPVLVFNNPANSAGYLNNEDTTLTASAMDTQSNISQVDFYFHDNDWLNDFWELLGSDTNSMDGWSVPFDHADQSGIALYVKAIDYSRNITGQGYWYLSIDRTPPQTALSPLEATQTSSAILLEWSGSDNLAGLDYYELQWAIDGGIWQNNPYTISGYTNSTWVVGTPGHSFSFRSRAIDRAGNTETLPASAETSTSIPTDICSSPDAWEIDNTANTASPITINQIQTHNFCNPETAYGLYDTDWITFTVQAGQRYTIQAIPIAWNSAAVISLFTDNGITLTLRSEMTQTVWGKPAFIDWIATTSEVLYISVRHADGRVAGNGVTYQIYATKNYPIYMPLVYTKP